MKKNKNLTPLSAVVSPASRAQDQLSLTILVREMLYQKEVDPGDGIGFRRAQDMLAEKVISMALSGNENMIRLIWEYMDGKPVNRVAVADASSKRPIAALLDHIELGDA